MAFEVAGKVIDISPVNQVSEKFRKREFVIEKTETGGASVFIDYIKFQLLQDKCDIINESFMNENVRIWFNLKGNKWERDGKISYFTNLDAWRIEKISSEAAASGYNEAPPPSFEDIPPEDEISDLPF